jgi:hypothetical protein
VLALAFASDGTRLLAGSTDGTAKLWQLDATPPACLSVLKVGSSHVIAVALSADGAKAWVAFGNRAIATWDLGAGQAQTIGGSDSYKELPTTSLGELRERTDAAVFSRDGRSLVIAGFDGPVRIVDLETGDEIERIDLAATSADRALAVAVTPAFDSIVVGTKRGLILRYVLAPREAGPGASGSEGLPGSPAAPGAAGAGWAGFSAVDRNGAVVVDGVAPDGPAARAGLAVGDAIGACTASEDDPRPIASLEELTTVLKGAHAGDTLIVKLRREGEAQPRQIAITLEARH